MTPLARIAGCALLVVVAASVPVGTSAAKWTKVQTPNFLFIGDASETEIRRVAEQLERFRGTLIRAFKAGSTTDPVPTIVVVFDTDRSFTPYKPRFQGKTVKVDGYVVSTDRVNYIAVTADGAEDDYRTVFHEYTHFVIGNLAGTLPLWLDEGLAQYYQTFEYHNGGRNVLLGRPAREDLDTLHAEKFVRLAELTSVTRDSAEYNTGKRRAIFYAESWGLVHYLLGDPARTGQFADYLARLRSGTLPLAAFAEAFHTDVAALETELKLYFGRQRFPATQFTFDDKLAGADTTPGVALTEPEAQAYLWELVALAGRVDDARPHLQQLARAQPPLARAMSTLGLIELEEGHRDTALPLIERAADLMPDDAWTQAALGHALMDRVRSLRASPTGHEETLSRARLVLAQAVTLQPRAVSTLVDLALVDLEDGANADRTRALLEEASARAPARESYRLLLAQAMLNQRQFDDASALLERLAAAGIDPITRQNATLLLQTVGRLRTPTRGLFVIEYVLPPPAAPVSGTRVPR